MSGSRIGPAEPMRVVSRLLPILPNLLLDGESDEEVLIYTGFRQTQDGRLEGITT